MTQFRKPALTTDQQIDMLAFLLTRISPQSTWRERLKSLIAATPQVDTKEMGFPDNWLQKEIWKGKSA